MLIFQILIRFQMLMITKMALCVFQTLSEDVIHQCCGHSGEPAPETAKQDAEPGTTCQYLLSLIILSPFLVISVFLWHNKSYSKNA